MKEGLRSCGVPAKMENDNVPLIILVGKKKGRKSSGGGGGGEGGGSSGKEKVFELSKEKKRLRLASSDTESEKDLSARRKVGRKNNADRFDPVVVKKNSVGSRKRKRKAGVKKKNSSSSRLELVKCKEEVEISGDEVKENGTGTKRSRLDVFEYTEDDLVDYKTVKKEIETARSRGAETDGKKCSKSGKKNNPSVKRNKGVDRTAIVKCEIEEEEPILSASRSKEESNVSPKHLIRVEDETGDAVDPKKVDQSEKTFEHSEADENRSLKSVENSIGRRTRSSVKLENSSENLYSLKVAQEENRLPKRLLAKKNERHLRTVDKDTNLQLGLETVDTYPSEKKERNKGKQTSKFKRGLSSKFPRKHKPNMEKQLIRDQIIKMVESAGWKIDYRPRSYKDYSDAVYIDLAGAVYWSILRAYYALQKQWESMESDQKHYRDGFSFTPIPNEVLDKLTRRTKKRIEREQSWKGKAGKRVKDAEGKIEKKSNGNKLVKMRIKREQKLKGKAGKGIKEAKEKIEKKSTDGKKVKKSKSNSMNGKSLKAKLKKNGLNQNRVKRPASIRKSGTLGNAVPSGLPVPAESFKASLGSDADLLQGRKTKSRRGYALLVRKSDKEVNSEGDQLAYLGKRTVLSWLIDSEVVPLGGKVQYMNKKRTRSLFEGLITRDGINCGCCSEIVTISEFQTHAKRKLRQPCHNLYVETGVPLFQCQIDAWNKQLESEGNGFHRIDISSDDPNDDTCGICGDGGDLICCDGCPSTFHLHCLAIQALPKGDWHCFNCCCKFCGIIGCSNSEGDDKSILNLLTCSLCEEKYHGSCVLQRNAVPVADSLCSSSCGPKCRELSERLQKLLGVKHELEESFSWTIIQRFNIESEASLSGLPEKVECNSKLALALSVMDECFLPTIDERSGINLIRNVVYNCGSNFHRLNFSGFYTYVLERDDEIIAAATIRLHGTSFAEMPFIGTRHIYRRQGMCRRLLDAIELSLSSLNVEKLVIPAISELMDTWTKVFGFSPLEESCKHEVRSSNMIVFPGIDLLQKILLKCSSAEVITDGSVLKAIELESSNHITTEAICNSDRGSVQLVNLDSDATGIIDEVFISKIGFQAPDGLVHDTSDASNPSYVPSELVSHLTEAETLCLNSRSQHETKSETNPLLAEAIENPTMNSSVEPNLQDSIQCAVDDTQTVNIKVDDLPSLAETSFQHKMDVPNECQDLNAPEGVTECYKSQSRDESSISSTETNSLQAEAIENPTMNSSVEPNLQDSIEGALDDTQNVNIRVDDRPSLAETSYQQKMDVPNEGLDLNAPEGLTECYKSQSRDESSTSSTEPQSLITEAENGSLKYSCLKCGAHESVDGAISDVQVVIMNINGVESTIKSFGGTAGQQKTEVNGHG
ncbi:Acyl-CoA N-acyltransferase with RING/FYVE/PHD-type zinc finger protein [Thalictrum thalictroides]|uniref:Acyl-CoA N-acyltransferase with RING/FYVE/PHD-type zinc finger protein n=1 Tax=Thalictrum thalictroides TaxID=46969 RepID=A0A7J6WAG7_THATH|nr:Acyl-CoA N-acyltransferase with RING/FYVE/PHD-type zinc finger protein [Thalictrum thalictroides]